MKSNNAAKINLYNIARIVKSRSFRLNAGFLKTKLLNFTRVRYDTILFLLIQFWYMRFDSKITTDKKLKKFLYKNLNHVTKPCVEFHSFGCSFP